MSQHGFGGPWPAGQQAPTITTRAIALGLIRTGRAIGRASQCDLDTLQLPAADYRYDFYFIDFDGRAVLRGNSLSDAELLQAGFRRAMAAAGRGGDR